MALENTPINDVWKNYTPDLGGSKNDCLYTYPEEIKLNYSEYKYKSCPISVKVSNGHIADLARCYLSDCYL